jgi:hypothetical protein
MDITGAAYVGQSFTQATNFAVDSAVGTDVSLNRTELGNESADAKTLTLNGITNPTLSGNFLTVYVRITVFSDDAYTTAVHEGTVAGSVNRQLVVTGRVQERLVFCVAAIERGEPMPATCTAAPATTTIDIGVIDNLGIAKAPVETDPISGANDAYGMALLNTNASNGAIIQFIPIESTLGTEKMQNFRVNGADCVVGASSTDQCFENADVIGEVLAAGTERFGMAIGCIYDNGTTQNLGFTGTAFNGNNDADCANAGNNDTDRFSGVTKFAWVTGSNPVTIAESSSVVDDEILHLTFAASAAATTPTGAYSVTSMYIATPTF